jgi:hypothetical protein
MDNYINIFNKNNILIENFPDFFEFFQDYPAELLKFSGKNNIQ